VTLAEAVIKLYRMPREEREAMGRRGRAWYTGRRLWLDLNDDG